LGVRSTDGAAIKTRDGGTVTLTNSPLTNTAFSAIASFSSGGPRLRDSSLKPDVAAPGVSTLSTAVGTGNQGERLSGTSMAAPHVSGVAALVVQAQKQGRRDDDEDGNGVAERVKAAIMNTASATAIAGYRTRTSGAGLVQAYAATHTRAIATGDRGTASLSFGYNEFLGTYTATKRIRVQALRGEDGEDAGDPRFTAAATMQSGAPHTVSLSRSSIRLSGERSASIDVTLTVPGATTGNANAFREASGFIELTPVNGANNGIALRVPYYLVPRGLSNTAATLSSPFGPSNPSGTVHLTNAGGAFTGTADFYAWGISSPNDGHGQTDLRAAGAQSFPSGTRRLIVFAVNTWERFSNAAVNEYDILVDTNGDGVDDFLVFGADNGLVRTGSRDGVFLSGVVNLTTGSLVLTSTAIATDNSTVFIPVFSNRLGLSAASPRFSYHIDVFAGRDGTDDIGTTSATFNAFTPAISTGAFDAVAPGAAVVQPVSIDAAEWARTPALGLLVVGIDNAAGASEGILLGVPTP